MNWQAAGVTAPDAAQESFASLSGAQKLVFIEHVGKVLDYASLPEALWTQGTTSTADDVARPGQAAGWSTLSAAQRQVVVAWLDGQLNTSARVTLQGSWASAATANMAWSAAGVATPTTAQTTWASLKGAQLMTLLEHLGYSYDYASIPDASWQGAAGTTDDVSRPLQSQSWSQLSGAQRAVLVRYVDTERSASVTTVPVYVKAYAAEVTVPSDRLIMQGNWANMSSAATMSWTAAGVTAPTSAQTTWAHLTGAQQMALLEHGGYVYDYRAVPDAVWSPASPRPSLDTDWSELSAAQRSALTTFIDVSRATMPSALPASQVPALARQAVAPEAPLSERYVLTNADNYVLRLVPAVKNFFNYNSPVGAQVLTGFSQGLVSDYRNEQISWGSVSAS